MKKIFVLSLSLLTILSLGGCIKKNTPTSITSSEVNTSDVTSSENPTSENPSSEINSSDSSSSSSSEEKPLYKYKEYGEKTSTSLEVKFYVNLPGDDGLYCKYNVEPGTKIKRFACSLKDYYLSYWYYDKLGLEPFDFDTAINENLSLYAYNRPKVPGSDPVEIIEEGEFTITYNPGKNVSIVEKENMTLPSKANKDQEISFYLAFNYNVSHEVVVKVNNQVVSSDANGIYTFKVEGNTLVETSDAEILEFVDTNKYEFLVDSSSYDMVINPANTLEYMAEGITLNVGDTFKVKVTDENDNVSYYSKALTIVDGIAQTNEFTCTKAGIYSFYFDTQKLACWVSGPLVNYTFTNCPSWLFTEDVVVYAWAWMDGQEGGWYEATLNSNDHSVSLLLNDNMYGLKFQVYDAKTFTGPTWDNKVGETPADYELTTGVYSYDGSKIWIHYTDEVETYRFYFKNTLGWSTINYYTWGASGPKSSWPGEAMTLVDGTTNIYYCEININKYASIIFNNGSAQTVDISLVGVDNNSIFELTNMSGAKYNVSISPYNG
ncbi:MAG: starch-binding protein [Bacilli bacterium]|nr:starch-binding protein [Bacilli bacterium]